ncbi:uncharacterized protein LOC130443000 [Diorhabda sublineata]|uniref:uncharacterized protein LOC130443000 n=1 Tax=Diorhabda sublineata TaxID=1163346 RepID=UPI0024E124F9|nr:uncharacterized protein LOC130443000 [Diorhabda sublineata]
MRLKMANVHYYLLLVSLICARIVDGYNHSHRGKRYIVYPKGGSYKLVIGIGTPLKLGLKQSMAIGWNLQMQYSVPQNASQILTSYPPVYTGKRSVDSLEIYTKQKSDRALFYGAFEEILDNHGLNGKHCLLRSICENAMDSLAHDANGLFGHLFDIILTPNYGTGELSSDLDPVYLEAQQAGIYGVDCKSLYTDCFLENGFLGLFSILDDKLY